MDGESQSVAKSIRLFFRAMRGSPVPAHLEIEVLRLRSDFEQRLLEKDQIVAAFFSPHFWRGP